MVLEPQTVLPPTKDAPELADLATVLQTPCPKGWPSPSLRANTQLTTQEAAALLDVSRPTLVRLLEDGEIPVELRGRHRRVMLADVIAYQQRARTRRHVTLDEMTRTDDDTTDGFIETR